MISNSFKGAYTNEVNQRNQGISTITSGVKSAALLVAAALGFSGALGEGALAQGAEHAFAGRIGGIGGNIMLATMNEKKATAQANSDNKQMFSREEVSDTINSQLGDNPINRNAVKKLNTVFETLVNAKEQGIIENGKIKSDIGDIDPNSELGKKVITSLGKEDKK